jgi:hypothetical protein
VREVEKVKKERVVGFSFSVQSLMNRLVLLWEAPCERVFVVLCLVCLGSVSSIGNHRSCLSLG